MTMVEAASRLRILADAYHAGRMGVPVDGGLLISAAELEAVTVAAAILGMFVEALEDET